MMRSKQKMLEMLDTIQEMFPNAKCELNHRNEFDLLIAVLLSAQCTDKLVNKVTAVLFQKYHTPEDYVRVPLEELQTDIRSIGLYRNKSKNIQALCQTLIEKYNSEVPQEREALEALPGVGRKTANVVLSVAFGVPALWFQCIACFFKPFVVCTNMLFQSIGKSGLASLLSSLRNGTFFIPLILILPALYGTLGIQLTQAVADVLSFFLCVPLLLWYFKKLPNEKQTN